MIAPGEGSHKRKLSIYEKKKKCFTHICIFRMKTRNKTDQSDL